MRYFWDRVTSHGRATETQRHREPIWENTNEALFAHRPSHFDSHGSVSRCLCGVVRHERSRSPVLSAGWGGGEEEAGGAALRQSPESNREMDFSDQGRIFGSLLGSVPTRRAKTNGVVIYKGYAVAEFGDTTWADPTYSVAKSMLATVAGIAVREGKIANLDAPVGTMIKDGGYDSPRNAQVTWKMHLQQETEWEGNMWGKQDDFVGHEAFGEGERKPGELKKPGTFYEYNDVRINRLALSLLRTFKESVPDVFRREVMDPIGASNTWRWIPYHNSFVDVGGK